MYYVVYSLCFLFSLLPLKVIYFISDGIYALGFHIIRYRRDVVTRNLLIAFPGKTEAERLLIAKKFYRNLIDMFLETIKMISMPEKELRRRFTGNWDEVNSLYSTGKSVQIHVGHNFNWEWGNMVFAMHSVHFKLLAVYMPFTSKIVERLFYKLRTKKGAIFLRATHMKEDFQPHKESQYVLALVADQNPGRPGNAWWFNFFGKPTPFAKGPAKAAIEHNTAVVFAFIHKPKRGYYEAVFSHQTNEPGSFSQEQLTGMFVAYLENVIRKYPDMWLWSHRRWKHEWKEEFGRVISPNHKRY